jgi:hypothetical protein
VKLTFEVENVRLTTSIAVEMPARTTALSTATATAPVATLSSSSSSSSSSSTTTTSVASSSAVYVVVPPVQSANYDTVQTNTINPASNYGRVNVSTENCKIHCKAVVYEYFGVILLPSLCWIIERRCRCVGIVVDVQRQQKQCIKHRLRRSIDARHVELDNKLRHLCVRLQFSCLFSLS